MASFGLIRQYLPKGQSMARLTQHDCNAIARQLNTRPRKRLGYRTPEECYARRHSLLHFRIDIKRPARSAATSAMAC